MRNTIIENQSHAISLNYATNSFGTIFSGFIIFGAGQFMREFDEGKILLGISILGFIGVYYVLKMKVDVVESVKERLQWKSYDWVWLMKAIVPTLIIAVGAGLSRSSLRCPPGSVLFSSSSYIK